MRINSVPDIKCFYIKKCVLFTINGMTFRAPICILIRWHKRSLTLENIANFIYFLRLSLKMAL